MIIGPDFIQKELFMFFSDENRFIHDLYEITSIDDTRVMYKISVSSAFKHFKSKLTPDQVFEYIDQIADNVKEIISDQKIDYHNWNDLLFHKDTTFDVEHFEDPKPSIIFKCEQKVGSLGKVLLCFGEYKDQWYLTLRDLQGNIFLKEKADINELDDVIPFRSLSLAAMPKEFFSDNKDLWSKIEDVETDAEDLEERVTACETDVQNIPQISVIGSALVIR